MVSLVMTAFLAVYAYGVPESSSEGTSEPACLLQSTFKSNDLNVDEEHLAGLAPESKRLGLYEFGATEQTTTTELMIRSKARSRSCKAHLFYLDRQTRGFEHAHNVSNKKMDELVKGFISKQSGSQDSASSQLMEAKHQLNQLHEHVLDLIVQVNTTERAILALDKQMEEKVDEIKQLDKWKADSLAECARKKKEYIDMYGKLRTEMIEMKQIASPGVSMDIKTGEQHTEKDAWKKTGVMPGEESLIQVPKQHTKKKQIQKLQGLIQGTQAAAKSLSVCMAKKRPHKHTSAMQQAPEGGASAEVTAGGLTIDDLKGQKYSGVDDAAAADGMALKIKKFAATPEECKEQKEILQETYVKTYVELSRLKDEYDELANSTACEDQTETKYKAQKAPIQEDIDQLIKDIDKKTKELQALRPRLEAAEKAENELRKHIKVLTQETEELPETVSNLDKVRDAIQALSKCPGLSRVQFSLPKWIGSYVILDLSVKDATDEELDNAFNAACEKKSPGSRAAETSEIEEQTVEAIPETNTAEFPLIGACPSCDGEELDSLPSKHKRVCWRPTKELNHEAKSKNCASGRVAVLCVDDRGSETEDGTKKDFRTIPGETGVTES